MPKKSSWKKSRRQEHLKVREAHFIFCEGRKTEPNYFQQFKQLIEENPIYREMVRIEIEPCEAETTHIVEMAERYVKKYGIKSGHIWCVYDKDDFPAEKFNEAAARLELLNGQGGDLHYHAAWSNECIEFWFVLHFTYYTSNNHRTEYSAFLRERLGSYEKNMSNIFDLLAEKGNPKLAIRYAKRIILENSGKPPAQIAPGTKVYELVESLAEYLPENVKELFLEESAATGTVAALK